MGSGSLHPESPWTCSLSLEIISDFISPILPPSFRPFNPLPFVSFRWVCGRTNYRGRVSIAPFFYRQLAILPRERTVVTRLTAAITARLAGVSSREDLGPCESCSLISALIAVTSSRAGLRVSPPVDRANSSSTRRGIVMGKGDLWLRPIH